MPRFPLRVLRILALLGLVCLRLHGGEAYFTGFETFTAGNDTIIGTESWTGSYAGTKLHGVMTESEHGVVGIGKAAFIGGYATTATRTASGSVVHVSKAVNLDPVALNQPVATFSVVFGIKDSTTTKRDNFEFLIYNQSNALLGGIQFDNTTLDSSTGKPRRLIYRLSWNAATSAFQYVLTSYNFLPETLETLKFRINYETNVWTAYLSDVPVFENVPFYTGAATKNLGTVMVKMAVTNTTANTISPGDNYMIFDDFTVRTDALAPAIQVEQPAATALTSATSTIDFGSSQVGSPSPLTFTIRNNGEAPLTGIAVTRDGTDAADYTITSPPATTLAVAASTTFTVSFNPSGIGSRTSVLHVASNDSTQNPFDVNLTGIGLGIPEIGVEQPAGTQLTDGTSTVSFGSIAVGSNADRSFTLRNTGTADLTGLTVTRNGSNATDFTITAQPATVAGPAGSTTFTVRFKPGGAGARTATLHVASNDSDENPFDLTLSGTGIAAPEISIQQPAGTELKDGVSSKSFGSVALKSTVTKSFTIRNTGTAKLKNLTVTRNGTHAKDFTVSAPAKTSLSPGSSTTFEVTFKPSDTGKRKAAIHVASNDGNENPFDITLTGKGVAAKSSAIAADAVIAAEALSGIRTTSSRPSVANLWIDGWKYVSITVPKVRGRLAAPSDVEVSPNLVDWFSGPQHTTVIGDSADAFTVRDNTPLRTGAKRYIRLKVTP